MNGEGERERERERERISRISTPWSDLYINNIMRILVLYISYSNVFQRCFFFLGGGGLRRCAMFFKRELFIER